jgi:hypothetical protein
MVYTANLYNYCGSLKFVHFKANHRLVKELVRNFTECYRSRDSSRFFPLKLTIKKIQNAIACKGRRSLFFINGGLEPGGVIIYRLGEFISNALENSRIGDR